MQIQECITKRKSVRTFRPERIRDADEERLQQYLAALENPLQIPVTFRILETAGTDLTSPVIVGAQQYVGAKVRRVPGAEIAFGYSFESFVLYAESLGIGTVWLAATLARKAFEKAMEVGTDEFMPAVSPIGYAASKRSLRESVMRKALRSDSRKNFSELFFDHTFSVPLTDDNAGVFLQPLQMLRLAPSAKNKQPWRVVLGDDIVHFYEKKNKGYIAEATGDIQKVDVGIGLAHFALTAKECGVQGEFICQNPGIEHEDNVEYIISFQRK